MIQGNSFWQSARKRAVSASDAVSAVRSGTSIFVHGAAATPTPLLEALASRRDLAEVLLAGQRLASE